MKRFTLFALIAAASFCWGIATMRYQVFPFDVLKGMARATELSPGDGTADTNARDIFLLNTRDANVVFVGDSLTRDGPWQDSFEGLAVANRGIGGETTADIMRRLDTITSTKAERAFLMAGINDLYAGRSPNEIARTYFDIIRSLRARGMEVVVQSTVNCSGACQYQQQIAELNGSLKAYAKQQGLRYIDLNASLSDAKGLKREFTTDGVHLSSAGYRQWINAIRPVLGE